MSEGDLALGPDRCPKSLEVPAPPGLRISYCSPSNPNKTTIAASSEPPSVHNMNMWSADISHLDLCALRR